jgi:hypothetical protein
MAPVGFPLSAVAREVGSVLGLDDPDAEPAGLAQRQLRNDEVACEPVRLLDEQNGARLGSGPQGRREPRLVLVALGPAHAQVLELAHDPEPQDRGPGLDHLPLRIGDRGRGFMGYRMGSRSRAQSGCGGASIED